MKQVSIWIKETNGFESEKMEFVVNFATVVKKVEGVTWKRNSTSFYSFNPVGTVTCPTPLSEFIQVLLFPEAGEDSRNWNFFGERSGVDSKPLPRTTFDSLRGEYESKGLRISNRFQSVKSDVPVLQSLRFFSHFAGAGWTSQESYCGQHRSKGVGDQN